MGTLDCKYVSNLGFMGKTLYLCTFTLYDPCVQAVRARSKARMGQERVTAVGAGRGTSA